MLAGESFAPDDSGLLADRARAAELLERFNAIPEREAERAMPILRELLGNLGEGCHVIPPFRCDFGYNVHVDDGAFINFDVAIMDGSPVHIGKRALIGPRSLISTAVHPIDIAERATGRVSSEPVTICDDVWLGAGVIVAPGVTIGEGSVIGAGSVVTHDIPSGVVAVGSPCRVIRQIGQDEG